MKDLKELAANKYSSDFESWKNAIKAEFKSDSVDSKIKKYSPELGSFPVLALTADMTSSISSNTHWKKASQTYFSINSETIIKQIQEDLDGGVRIFFFHGPSLAEKNWELIKKFLESFDNYQDLEVFILSAPLVYSPSKFKLFQGSNFLMNADLVQKGGHNIHELGLIVFQLILAESHLPDAIGVYVDSHFFRNIAKIRALKLLVLKVLKELNQSKDIFIVALNSYSDWTLYERYSNILRNTMQVSSALIAGADIVQSSGYQSLFHLETDIQSSDHEENSFRMARNSSHVLALESMLGIVDDASYGCFYLESLTQAYAEEAWKFMQKLLGLTEQERETLLRLETEKNQASRLDFLRKRKKVIAGINDFPDAKEKLNIKLKNSPWLRPARLFEELRLKVEKLPNPRVVKVLVSGDLSLLNARLSFIRNYFELLGLEVIEGKGLNDFTNQDVIVICAKDEDYAHLITQIDSSIAFHAYIAGKVNYPGFSSIYAGQDVYDELHQLVQKFQEFP